jgi:D-alanyl-D-alanine carboxypeptidase
MSFRLFFLLSLVFFSTIFLNEKSFGAINTIAQPVKFNTENCPQSYTDDSEPYFLQPINPINGVPKAYVPKNLVDLKPYVKTSGNVSICVVKKVADAVYNMSKDMEKSGLTLMVVSGYRSYQDQQALFNIYAPQMNKGTYHRVAPAGHSEHQLGTTIDVASEFKSGTNFALSSESNWMKNNAHKYGFVISYDEGHEENTGYQFEPWHFRYVGPENALILRSVDYSLAYKPIYYKKTWIESLFSLLNIYAKSPTEDVSFGG